MLITIECTILIGYDQSCYDDVGRLQRERRLGWTMSPVRAAGAHGGGTESTSLGVTRGHQRELEEYLRLAASKATLYSVAGHANPGRR